MAEEASYPDQYVASDSIVVKLCGQAFVWNNIECLTEVQQYGVYLFAVIKSLSKVLKCKAKLAFCRPPFSETMLGVTQDVVSLEVCHDLTVYHMFKDFAANRG